jgi:hypothetical protein
MLSFSWFSPHLADCRCVVCGSRAPAFSSDRLVISAARQTVGLPAGLGAVYPIADRGLSPGGHGYLTRPAIAAGVNFSTSRLAF